MARRSVAYNNLEDKINIVLGDIKKASEIFGKNSFDVITSNPPYMEDTHGLKNPELSKAIARHELHCSFEDIAREGILSFKTRWKVLFGASTKKTSRVDNNIKK